MIDIIMLSNTHWHISEMTKQSLMLHARKDRVILQCEPNYNGMEYCTIPILDTVKREVIRTKATSEFIYILDDDDWLEGHLEPVKDGYDGAIYNANYKGEILDSIDLTRMGVGFGYIRCLFRREFLLKACDVADSLDLKTCFDVFLLYYLGIDGKYEKRPYNVASIDEKPRTMLIKKFEDRYAYDLHKIRRYFGAKL